MRYFTDGNYVVAVNEPAPKRIKSLLYSGWCECSKAEFDASPNWVDIGRTHFLPMYGVFLRPEGHSEYTSVAWVDDDFQEGWNIVKSMVEQPPLVNYCEFVLMRDHDSAIMLRGSSLDQYIVDQMIEHQPLIPFAD